MRNDASSASLREALAAKGVSASETILAGLIEGEDESRSGVLEYYVSEETALLWSESPDWLPSKGVADSALPWCSCSSGCS